MLALATGAWSRAAHAARSMPLPFLAGFLILALSGWAGDRLIAGLDITGNLTSFDPTAPLPTPGAAVVAAIAAAVALLAAGWLCAGVLVMRCVLRQDLAEDAAAPRGALSAYAGFAFVLLVPPGLGLAGTAVMMGAVVLANERMGLQSAFLTMLLLMPVAFLAAAAAARFSLAPAPAAIGLSHPLADSYAATRGHLVLLTGATTLSVLPLLLLGQLPLGLTGVLDEAWSAALNVAFLAVQAALIAALYERWHPRLRPDHRPSHNPAHRLAPTLDRQAPFNG